MATNSEWDMFKNGDPALFRRLNKVCRSQIIRSIMKKGGTYETGQEIYQQAVFIAFEKAKKNLSFTLTSALCTFLHGIAFNLYRKRNNNSSKLLITDPSSDVLNNQAVDGEVSLDETKRAMVARLFSKLSEKCQKTLFAKLEEKSNEEVALEMGHTKKDKQGNLVANLDYVKVSIHRCKAKLKKLLLNDPWYKDMYGKS